MSSRNGTAFPADRASGVSATPTLDAHQQSALALDAYSQTVIAVADALSPSVANLQVQRRTRRGPATGAGSGVAISPDGFVITSAHVVEGTRHGVASFDDGRETPVSVVGVRPAVGPGGPARRRRRPRRRRAR